MGKQGTVTILEVSPGFESIRTAVVQSLGKAPLSVVASNSAALLRIQEAFAGDPQFVDSQASGLVELITVGQLVSKLCASAGIATTPTLDLDRQAAIIGLIAQRLSDDSAFAASKHLPGFYEAAATTLQEMRHQRISLDSVGLPPGKLRDIALLQEGLSDELERRKYSTLSQRIDELIGVQSTHPVSMSRVLWLPEREWPELRLQLLEWMLQQGFKLTLIAEKHPGNQDFFSATESLMQRFPNAEFNSLRTNLTVGSQLFSNEDFGCTGHLRIIEASDDFIEVEWALRECRRLIRSEGMEAKQIVLFARNLETYGPLLRAASDREGLPLTIDYAEPLKAHPFCRYLLGALKSLLANGIGGAVSLIRSDYGQVPIEQRDAVEEELRGLASEPDIWKAIGIRAQAGTLPAWFGSIANWRRIALDGQRKPADWMRGVEHLMASTPWLQSCSPREETAKDAMVRSLMIGLLALDPHEGMTLSEFAAFADRTWSSAEYRVRTQGGIRVVSDPSAIGLAARVIAVGIIEGRFPSRRAEDPILLDRDREALRSINPEWSLADSYERAVEDDRDFYRLLCSCDHLTLCYPSAAGENPQEPAAYLRDLELLPGVSKEQRTFSQRFPKPDECETDRELLASIIWHGEPGFEPMDSITARVEGLRSAHWQSQQNSLNDDILRAKLGALPHPMRITQLRSVSQCPFQYFARHKLGLRSKKGDPINGVIVNCIRRANFSVADEGEFVTSLNKALEAELESLQGVLNEHEIQLIRFAAPTTLQQFAKTEMAARSRWNLTPIQVAPPDENAGLRQHAKFGEAKVTLSPSIDVLYKREGTNDLVPMRIGWETDEDQFKKECYLVMMMHPGEPKFVMFDAFNNSRRTLFCRRSDGQREKLEFKGNLGVDIGPKQIRELRSEVTSWMSEILAEARSGSPTARPNSKNCYRCDLGSFCRSAPYANPAVDWAATVDVEEPNE